MPTKKIVIRFANPGGATTRVMIPEVPATLNTKQAQRLRAVLGDLSQVIATGPDGYPVEVLRQVTPAGEIVTLTIPGPFYTCGWCGKQGQDTVGSGRQRKWCSDACRMLASRWGSKRRRQAYWAQRVGKG